MLGPQEDPGALRVEAAQVGLDDVPADHHRDQLGLGQRLDRPRADQAAVAQDADRVAEGEDLLELVRDEDDGDALVPQAAQDAEEIARLRAR